MKVRITESRPGGFGGYQTYACVIELEAGEPQPENSIIVPNETPVSDWEIVREVN